MSVSAHMQKARAFLQDAQLCSGHERYDSAASRAYYAMFRAALALMEQYGYLRPAWNHGRLKGALVRSMVEERAILMKLSHKEDLLVERVIEKIKEIDPAARVKVSFDTVENEDVVILVYTDKSTLEIVRHTAPYTVDIAAHEGLDIVVLPMDRESNQ